MLFVKIDGEVMSISGNITKSFRDFRTGLMDYRQLKNILTSGAPEKTEPQRVEKYGYIDLDEMERTGSREPLVHGEYFKVFI